mmetsp:Transcript_1583/g.4670  ORF Transcript_1583/g.4670 Transcript_1583/m.4670 type:complete len:313 (-) Transcript_1583:1216-2154(-)
MRSVNFCLVSFTCMPSQSHGIWEALFMRRVRHLLPPRAETFPDFPLASWTTPKGLRACGAEPSRPMSTEEMRCLSPHSFALAQMDMPCTTCPASSSAIHSSLALGPGAAPAGSGGGLASGCLSWREAVDASSAAPWPADDFESPRCRGPMPGGCGITWKRSCQSASVSMSSLSVNVTPWSLFRVWMPGYAVEFAIASWKAYRAPLSSARASSMHFTCPFVRHSSSLRQRRADSSQNSSLYFRVLSSTLDVVSLSVPPGRTLEQGSSFTRTCHVPSPVLVLLCLGHHEVPRFQRSLTKSASVMRRGCPMLICR